jgi:hypothetical protein
MTGGIEDGSGGLSLSLPEVRRYVPQASASSARPCRQVLLRLSTGAGRQWSDEDGNPEFAGKNKKYEVKIKYFYIIR